MFTYTAPDRATRVGYMIGDAFIVAFAVFMIFGLVFR